MKLAIMQPYFFPYLGYWQLINAVDEFVVYDNIQYTKKGWFNRNRYLLNGKDEIFTIPLKKDSDFLNVDKRYISETFDKKHLLSKFQNAYAKAPYKKETMEILKQIVDFDSNNLFEFIYNSIISMINYLDIKTKVIISSSIDIDHKNLKAQDKVIAVCNNLNASNYINAIGGQNLYTKDEFDKYDIKLNFIKMKDIKYKQFNNEFVPNLSIIDVLMFNSPEQIREMLDAYELI